LKVLFPDKKIIRYTAFKQGKDQQEMLDVMQKLSWDFILGAFAGVQDMSFQSVLHKNIENYLGAATIKSIPDPEDFFGNIETLVPDDTIVVVTGSLYWLARVYSFL
jgi:folylpolyglutamate synthase/dihydropteroate synthase